jgi:hypothetical protein
VPLYFILQVEVIRCLNLFQIQMSLKFIKDFKDKKVFYCFPRPWAKTKPFMEIGPAWPALALPRVWLKRPAS